MRLKSAICILGLFLTNIGFALELDQTFPMEKVPLLTYLVDYEAAWSPDGQSIVLISNRHGGLKVHILSVTDGGSGSKSNR